MKQTQAIDCVEPEYAKQLDPTPEIFPVTYSILSPTCLAKEVQSDYPLCPPVTCDPLHLGLNDTYLIHTGNEPYVLRIYRFDWRSSEDVLYELDLLKHLHGRGILVAIPVTRRNGQLVRFLPAPEGIRMAVLFTYAAGKRPTETAPYVHLLGQTIGQLHAAGEDFTSPHTRFPLDLEYFLDHPQQALRPILAHRSSDWDDLVAVVEEVRTRAKQIPMTGLQRGVCHGDIDWKNLHIADDGGITLFDFDNGGAGWHAFDLATFRIRAPNDAVWNEFLDGYQTERTIDSRDLRAVPLFMVMLRIYMLGFVATHRHTTPWGAAMLRNGFVESELAFLREWMRTRE